LNLLAHWNALAVGNGWGGQDLSFATLHSLRKFVQFGRRTRLTATQRLPFPLSTPQ
jgi:hypothetical protein